MRRLLFAPLLLCLASCSPSIEKLTRLPDLPEQKDKWVKSLNLDKDSQITFVGKEKNLLITSTWETKEIEGLTSITIGDPINALTVGAILCNFHTKDAGGYGTGQFMWRGRWSCLAGRNSSEILSIKKSFESNRSHNFPYLSISPITLTSSNNLVPPSMLAPMAIEDLEDPQKGYYHMPIGINQGNFFFASKGESRKKVRKIDFKQLSFWSEPIEIEPGFRPSTSFCTFNEESYKYGGESFPARSWTCGIFRSNEELITSLKSENQRAWAVDFIICNDCKPKADNTLSRICPGMYSSWLDPKRNWIDQAMPGAPKPFNNEGSCIHKKPWFINSQLK